MCEVTTEGNYILTYCTINRDLYFILCFEANFVFAMIKVAQQKTFVKKGKLNIFLIPHKGDKESLDQCG